MIQWACASLILISSLPAIARQFDFKTASVGTYIRGEYGLAQRGDASYADSSGTGVSIDQKRTVNAGGEFGLFFSGDKSIFRISAALLIPKNLSGAVGSNSSGTSLYTLDSKVLVFTPQVSLDLIPRVWPESRVLISMGGGLAMVTTTNVYKMTGGYSGVTDHTESGKGQGISLQASVAYEMMFADHATLVADVGYRYCRIATLTAKDAVTTFSGTYAQGASLKNMDGSDRSLDLGGLFAGLGFRFYF